MKMASEKNMEYRNRFGTFIELNVDKMKNLNNKMSLMQNTFTKTCVYLGEDKASNGEFFGPLKNFIDLFKGLTKRVQDEFLLKAKAAPL